MYDSKLTRILLVDDEADIRELAYLSLHHVGGLDVETCADGRKVVEVAEAFDPQLILLDVMMPGVDGPGALAMLQAHASLCAVPVVFLTAKAQPEEVARYLSLGAVEVIRKPFDAMQLPQMLDGIWGRLARASSQGS